MKKILMAAVAVAALASTPVYAADFAVTGTVQASCGAITGLPIAFGTIATGSDGSLTAGQSKSSASQSAYCNGANSTISVSHLALANGTGAAPTGFTRTIDFTTDVDFAGAHFTDGVTQSLGAKTGSLVVSANSLTASAKPLAGDYTGSITVTVTPAA